MPRQMRASLRLLWVFLTLTLGAALLAACPSGRSDTAGAPGAPGARSRLGIAAPAPAEPAGAEAKAAAPSTAAGADPAATSTPEAAPDPDGAARGLDGGLLSALAPVRVPRPAVPPGPRRIGLQAGHWRTSEVPEELRRLQGSVGTAGGGVPEWQLNLDVANRVAAILRGHGYEVDVLPTTIPTGYLADVFVALHADGSPDGNARGFKAAHGNRRGPYEGRLVQVMMDEYGRATGLPVDPMVTRNMLGYYAFSWSRFQSTVAPHTPAAILEMGFLTNATDRGLLLGRQDVVAGGVANGILRFLDEVPAGAAFADDLILPPSLNFRPQPTPAAR
ncbi:MAG TPA: N-acetylmuramoyl-L-alanine amidase [Chloroflexota bacterium]|nr:N-acetylmuramoyl-L-alanine amidase [Chloroflexota bacterium]